MTTKDPYWKNVTFLSHFEADGDPNFGVMHLGASGESVITANIGTLNLGSSPANYGSVLAAGQRCFRMTTAETDTTSAAYLYQATTGIFDSAFTLEWWSYRNTTIANPYGMMGSITGTSVLAHLNMSIHYTGTSYRLYCKSNFQDAVSDQQPLSKWVHHAVCYNGTVSRYFQDGVLKVTTPTGTSGASCTGIKFGYGMGYTTYGFPCYLKGIRMYRVAKYQEDFTPPPVGLPLYTSYIDASPLNNVVSATGSSIAPVSDNPKFGSGNLYFDGNSLSRAVVRGIDQFSFGTDDFTVEFWLKSGVSWTSQGANAGVLGGATQDWVFFANSSDTSRMWFRYNSIDMKSSSTPATGVWQHWAIVRVNGVLRMYLNGTLEVSDGQYPSTTINSANASGIWIGYAISTNGYLKGEIDDIRITKGVARYGKNPPQLPIQGTYTQNTDPCWKNVSLAMHMNDSIIDQCGRVITNVGSVLLDEDVVKFGPSSAYFSGSNYLTTPVTSNLLFGSGPFTVECWVNPTSTATSKLCGIWSDTTGSGFSWKLSINSSSKVQFTYSLTGGDSYSVLSYDPIPLNEFTHVAVTRDTSGYIRIYINGQWNGNWALVTSSFFNATGKVFEIGRDGAGTTNYFEGYIEDLRITNGVARYYLSSHQVPQKFPDIYPAEATLNGLALYLTGEGIDKGTVIYDIMGHAITNTGVTISSNQKINGTSSLYFNGSGSLSLASSAEFSFGTGDYTIEFWVYSQVMRHNNIIDMRPSTSGFYPVISLTDTGYVGFYLNGAWKMYSAKPVALNTWTHIAISRTSGVTSMFVNGYHQSSITDVDSYPSSPILIGNGYDLSATTFFTGYLDEFRITKGIGRYVPQQEFTPPNEPFPEGQTAVEGIVYDTNGLPCARQINIHSRADGHLIGSTVSDSTTGAYSVPASEKCYAVVLDNTGSYNSLIVDNIDPLI